MQPIDIYDFDRTIFKHDCYTEYFKYACRKQPWMYLSLIITLLGIIIMALTPWDVRLGKMITFIPIRLLYKPERVRDFWKEMDRIGWVAPWFRPQENDVPVVVCTSSPRFLVEPLLEGVRSVHCLLATEMDPYTLRITGRNNRGEEKARRVREQFPGVEVRIVGSDSLKHDAPILRLAQRPTLVQDFERTELDPKDL